MMQEAWRHRVDVPGESIPVTVAFDPAPSGDAVVVLGHGAGSHLDHATITGIAASLREVGISTVRYNFVYSEAKKGPPDRMPRLITCLGAVVAHV
ncbi:MAG: alpha/beta family hydrolase, partial [Fimbriimonas sp.]